MYIALTCIILTNQTQLFHLKVVILPSTIDALLEKASTDLQTTAKRILNSSGDEIQSIEVIRDGDVLIAAGDEPFVQGNYDILSYIRLRFHL